MSYSSKQRRRPSNDQATRRPHRRPKPSIPQNRDMFATLPVVSGPPKGITLATAEAWAYNEADDGDGAASLDHKFVCDEHAAEIRIKAQRQHRAPSIRIDITSISDPRNKGNVFCECCDRTAAAKNQKIMLAVRQQSNAAN